MTTDGSNSTPRPSGNPSGWAAVVVLAGLALVAGALVGVLQNFNHTQSKDMVAVISAVTAVVGTIVTAFFGIHATAKAGAVAIDKVDAAHKAAANRIDTAHKEEIGRMNAAHDKEMDFAKSGAKQGG